MKYRLSLILTLLCAAASAAAVVPANTFPGSLLTVARFISWPSGAMEPDAFVVCFQAGLPDELQLRRLAGMRLQGRKVQLHAIDAADKALACQLLYLPSTATERARYLEAVALRPVLTIGDDFAALAAGAHVLLPRAGRAHPEINVVALQRSGLRIDARMLRIARPSAALAPRS